ncbi:MAG: HAD-IB family hydrolase [Acidimicrobiia bacterium]|nr:HAD-IB family hydrolase [Acidimicrobiia bacterium]
MNREAAIFDLDRTLIRSSSAPVFRRHLGDAGLTSVRELPLADALMKFYERFGESWVLMQPARLAAGAARGWSVDLVAEAMDAAAKELEELLLPFARIVIEQHRDAGRQLVLATTSPEPFVRPFADRLGFDAVVATRWRHEDGAFTGELAGSFVWGRAKAEAVEAWANEAGADLGRSYAYSDSYFDAPLLASVGNPVPVNPDLRLQAVALIRGWHVRHFDAFDGVFKIGGRELQDWLRPLMRPELVRLARFEIDGIENIPSEGAAILVFNHRSYFDPSVMGLIAAKAGRSVRGLGKKEVFDVPVVGRILRGVGGVRVDRGTGSDEPLDAAAEALEGGEVLMMAPQGTIPRGPAFFDPELKGRWGAAKLAAATRAPVVPIGLWGTENVWPRGARLPRMNPIDRPLVTASVGEPVDLDHRDVDEDTRRIMGAIVDLLPPEAREIKVPTAEELALTYPPGYDGDPTAEADRRPGFDTETT